MKTQKFSSKVYQNRIWWKTNPSPLQIGITEEVTSLRYNPWSLQYFEYVEPDSSYYGKLILHDALYPITMFAGTFIVLDGKIISLNISP
jgi:hypothetical protein